MQDGMMSVVIMIDDAAGREEVHSERQ
jgi:hypothetical protein